MGTNHTLTGHVNVNDGSGFANAPAGTLITFSKVSGPGSFVGAVNTCTTIGTTGSCTVQITSATDIDRLAAQITARGGVLETAPFTMAGKRAFRLRDPDGFRFTIASPREA